MRTAVIGFSGKIGSGKSAISKALAAELGWRRVSFGEYVRSLAVERGLAPTREILQSLGEDLEAKDAETFCRAVVSLVDWCPGTPLIVDGIRHVKILEVLRHLAGPTPFILVFVEADDARRNSRLAERGDGEETRLRSFESHSTEKDVLDKLPRLADIHLRAHDSVENTLARLKSELEPW